MCARTFILKMFSSLMYLICLHLQLDFLHHWLFFQWIMRFTCYYLPLLLICIGPTPLLNAFMQPTLVINTHTLHQSLTYSFPSTRDPYSPHKLFTYSSASVCANNGEIIMWACLWVWAWSVCVCVSFVYISGWKQGLLQKLFTLNSSATVCPTYRL